MRFWKIIKWTWFPVALLIAVAYFYAPVTFLKGVSPEEIACITIFDGNTGSESEVTRQKDIAYIVENLQSVPVRRTGISILEPGYRFRMTFTDEKGELVETLTVNSSDTIRKDPFFLTTEEGGLCFDYIWDLMDAEHDFIGDF
ncbi:MAG: hypothetical protein IJA84_05980 [Clostridia bacterium]|nr:hypothetical protein [Clostridia bacterium]